jgi:hypothetical protein
MFERWFTLWSQPMFESDGGGSGAGAGEGGSGGDEAGGKEGAKGSGAGEGDSGSEGVVPEAEVQKRIDAAVKERLAREKKKSDGAIKNLQAQLDALAKGDDGGSGTVTTQQGGEDPVAKAAEILKQANLKVLTATAQTEAVKLGIDPKYAADAVKLADLSSAMQEDGSVDEKAVAKALDEVLKRVPAFKLQTQEGGAGFRVGGEGQQGGQKGNGWGSNGQQQQGTPAPAKRWNSFNR